MKKRLAMLLSVAMAFSMFANVAFGADATLTTTQKYEALVEAGIFNGIPGSTDPQLNVQTDRAQFAKILSLTTGLEQVTGVTSFKDAGYATNWAKGYIEAVVKAGYMNGVGGEKFNLTGKITGEQMAKSFALALGLEEVKDAAAIDGVSTWAYGWVTAIKEAGFDFSMNGKWNTPVTRAVLIDAAYAVKEKVGVQVEKVQVVDEKNIEVTFSDKEVVKVALDKALVEGQKTVVEVTHKGKTYNVEVTLEALSATTKLVGAKTIEVTFNRAVDTTKATFDVKSALGTKANVSKVTYNDNKTVATVEFVTNLLKGDYTVTVNGASEKAADAGKFSVEDEKVTKIEFLSDKAVLKRDDNTTVTTTLKVVNQYGEDITKAKASGLTLTASGHKVSVDQNGVLTIINANAGTLFKKDDKLGVTALDTNSTVFASTVVTVSDRAAVTDISITGIYHADKKVLTAGETAPQNWKLIIEAKDQYGNTVTDPAVIKADVISTVTMPTVVDATYTEITTLNIDGTNKLVLPLKLATGASKVTAGTSKVTLLSKSNGKMATYDVVVKEEVTVDTISLGQPGVAVVNEKTEIPFTAVDQFGKEITDADALNGGFLSLTAANGKELKFEQDYVTGKAKLYVTPEQEGLVVINAVSKKGKLATSNFNAVKAAEGKVVYATKDFTANFAVDGTNTLKPGHIKVQDQYGRDFDFAAAGYKVVVTTSDASKVELSASDVTNAQNVTLTGKAAGSSTITLQLVDAANKPVAGSEYTFTSRVVAKADITKYEVTDLKKLYNTGTGDYAAAVEVNGVLADGTKVVVPTTSYDVQTLNDKVTYANGKITANIANADFGSTGEIKQSVVVTVYADKQTAPITKELVISNAAPTATKAELTAGTKATKESDNVISIKASDALAKNGVALAKDVVKVVDQYGVKMSNDNLVVYVTNIVNNKGETITNDQVAAGSKYYVTAVAGNGHVVAFQVIVK